MENINFKMGMNMKAWQNPCSFAHEYSGWMNHQSCKGILGCQCNKCNHLQVSFTSSTFYEVKGSRDVSIMYIFDCALR